MVLYQFRVLKLVYNFVFISYHVVELNLAKCCFFLVHSVLGIMLDVGKLCDTNVLCFICIILGMFGSI